MEEKIVDLNEWKDLETYTGFANVYDEFMDNIPYDKWFCYVQELLKDNGVDKGLVLELGCGTGNMTNRLEQAGYDMIGIDLSEEMLEIAREKCSCNVLFLNQDMCEMELYGTVDAMVCVCDGMNYVTKKQQMIQLFKNANNYLEAGGVFIFDMKTPYFYDKILGTRMIAENRENASFLWDNEYHKDTKINEYLLTVYQLEDEENDLFSRCDEVHYQRAYEIEEMKDIIEEAGMECIAVYDAFTKNMPREDSERLYYVVKEKYQEGKYYNE